MKFYILEKAYAAPAGGKKPQSIVSPTSAGLPGEGSGSRGGKVMGNRPGGSAVYESELKDRPGSGSQSGNVGNTFKQAKRRIPGGRSGGFIRGFSLEDIKGISQDNQHTGIKHGGEKALRENHLHNFIHTPKSGEPAVYSIVGSFVDQQGKHFYKVAPLTGEADNREMRKATESSYPTYQRMMKVGAGDLHSHVLEKKEQKESRPKKLSVESAPHDIPYGHAHSGIRGEGNEAFPENHRHSFLVKDKKGNSRQFHIAGSGVDAFTGEHFYSVGTKGGKGVVRNVPADFVHDYARRMDHDRIREALTAEPKKAVSSKPQPRPKYSDAARTRTFSAPGGVKIPSATMGSLYLSLDANGNLLKSTDLVSAARSTIQPGKFRVGGVVSDVMHYIPSNDEGEKIKGGKASGKSGQEFDREALARGTKVELEHTSDKKIAQEIAMDHLMEDPRYYDFLDKMENEMEQTKKSLSFFVRI